MFTGLPTSALVCDALLGCSCGSERHNAGRRAGGRRAGRPGGGHGSLEAQRCGTRDGSQPPLNQRLGKLNQLVGGFKTVT